MHTADWLAIYERILDQYHTNPAERTEQGDVFLKLLMRVQGYQNQLKDANTQLQSQLQHTKETEEALSKKFNEQEAYFKDVKKTRSWRLIQQMQTLRNRLLPVGGKSEALLKRSYKAISRPFGQKK